VREGCSGYAGGLEIGSPSTVPDESGPPRTPSEPTRAAPVVVEVRGVEKSFRVPEHRIDTLKERAAHPLTRMEYRELRALRGISFDVHKGEFFGIVGRNGSGKSSLLKILASIYRADAGSVRMAGRVAPFIELGVGFNPELTARENGVLNGVLMGLTRREAQRRLGAVLEFAELEEFVDLKLKNYSSGMMVRFAFAVMVQADADIMLIDEVLAVGDAAFGQKCMDVFREKRRAGRTIVLVTHDMATVQSLCHRAMLIEDGQMQFIGEPEEAALRYLRLNFARSGQGAAPADAMPDFNVRVVRAGLLDGAGAPIENLERGAPIVLDILIEAARELERPLFIINVRNEDGIVVFGFTRELDEVVGAGHRLRIDGRIENPLVPGRYFLDCWIRQGRVQSGVGVQGLRLLQFVVYGTGPIQGVISVAGDVEPVLEPGPPR
jgi:ABC-2 type transport system ATP-binding protein